MAGTSETRTRPGRAALLTAARRTFSSKGYDGASIRDIAQEAGLSLSALYYYFPSKQDALLELICSTFDDFLGSAHAILQESGEDARSQLDALIRFIVRFRIANREGSRVLLRETERLDPERLEIARARQIASNELIKGVVLRGVEQGHFRTPYPEEAVRAVVSFCNSLPLWYREDGRLSPAQLEERYTHFAFRLLEADPETSRRPGAASPGAVRT